MALPIKASSSSTDCVIIDAYVEKYQANAELLAALGAADPDPLVVKLLAVKAVDADRQRPKYRRLGMKRIAWFYNATGRTLYRWWDAYQKGGVDALRRPTENLGRPPKVSTATLEGARDRLLARNAQAEAAKNVEAAKKARESKKSTDGGGGKGGEKRRPESPPAPPPPCRRAALARRRQGGGGTGSRCPAPARRTAGRQRGGVSPQLTVGQSAPLHCPPAPTDARIDLNTRHGPKCALVWGSENRQVYKSGQ